MKKAIIFTAILLASILIVVALDFTPKGNVDLQNNWNVVNVSGNYTVPQGNGYCMQKNDCTHRIYFNGTATIVE